MGSIKRRFCSHKAKLQKLRLCSDLWVSLPQSTSSTAPPSGGAQNSLPLMRKVSARLVAMTEGENHVSFDALNLWASKREPVISPNRIEPQNSCPLNLWGHEFVFPCAAAAGCRLSLPTVSFEISNQWISKRGPVISPNRIEPQNSCPLNLWGHEFVFFTAAAAGIKRPAFAAAAAGCGHSPPGRGRGVRADRRPDAGRRWRWF